MLNVFDNKQLENLNTWKYKTFECEMIDFTMDEIKLFTDEHWKSFKKACEMASEADRKSRSRENNIKVIW